VRRPVNWLLDHPWSILGAIIGVAFIVWAAGTRTQPHHVQARFESAFNLVSGLAVSVDGQEVGKISKVEYDGGGALVEIGINDERFWPLRTGTRLVSRWGTTIGSGTRRIDLVPGPAANPPLPEGGAIPASDTQAAVDLDHVFNSLNKSVRGDLRRSMASMDEGLGGRGRQLNGALRSASGGVEATGDVMEDLVRDTFALRAFLTNTHRLTDTLADRAPAVQGLITVAAQTFATFADNTRATQDSIAEVAPTMRAARTTLARVDSSVGKLDALTRALAPGAKRLKPLARTTRRALTELRSTLPSATDTVVSATKASPRIVELLNAATPFAKLAPDVFGGLAPIVGCMRPYAPEAAGAIVGAAGWTMGYDLLPSREVPEAAALDQPAKYPGRRDPNGKVRVHNLDAMPIASTTTDHAQTLTPAQFVAASGKQYAFPRPPGHSVGQPWFIPECGITPDGLDPSKDAEHRP